MKPLAFHHIAIIVSNPLRSLHFYVRLLGFEMDRAIYREERSSWKIDLIGSNMQLELFTFPDAAVRPSYPEALGLRHLAFSCKNVDEMRNHLLVNCWPSEEVRIDETTGQRFFFIADPDGLPIEFYEI